MQILSGHSLQQVLYESAQSRIYKGVRLLDGFPVIIKLLNQSYPSAERRARFEQEYRLMRRLGLEAIASAYSMVREQGQLAIVMEDFGGASLNKLDIAGRLPLDEWLRLAIHIAQRLGQLHARQVMHKDINLSNIVWNRETNQLKLIDLGIATELAHEVAEARPPDWLEGTLAYISPEQTGRMNRAVDYRTDFYSLGATLYELLTGQPPFVADDALKLMHAHIAKAPVPAHEHRLDVPAMVSAILDKLLAKTAEERYQSASGLVADLRTCLQTLDDDGNIPVFALGGSDFSLRLQIPQKLYGREQEVQAFLDAFERTARGSAELLLVAGFAGVGKSALVHEVHKPIAGYSGYFIEGKFDQFQRDIPYRALVQAFSRLIRQLLTERQAVVEQWKGRLLQALGNNAQVIVEVIPDLELLIGKQPALLELPPEQAKNRFNHEFRQFVAALATAKHPLTIFIDDLQWADLPSLELLSLLLRAPALPHLLLIGAYRDNEVGPGHVLAMTLDGLQKRGAAMRTITLPPLGSHDVACLLTETVHVPPAQVHELAQLCLNKTGGNPFFLNQFLMALADRDMLRLNTATGQWQWDIEQIRNVNITDNVVELMVAKLRKLSEPTQRVLQGAACLGNAFDLKTLAMVCQLPQADTAHLLWPALAEELIVPLDSHYKYAGQGIEDDGSQPTPHYRFLHDRVHQAANLLSGEAERAAMHLAIGRLWLNTCSPEQQTERLFDLVNHLNEGRSLIDNPRERHALADLNLQAGRRAKASAAYQPALRYLGSALELVDEQDWQQHYDLMLALHQEAAEAAYLSVDFEQMERHIKIGLARAANLLDRARFHEIRIMALCLEAKYVEALKEGLAVLRLLGVKYPQNPTRLHILLHFLRARRALAGKSTEQLAGLPNASDPRILAIDRIHDRLFLAAYSSDPEYLPLFIFHVILAALKHGYSSSAGSVMAAYGLALMKITGNVKEATRYAELALKLQQRPEMKAFEGRTWFIVHSVVLPWSKALHETAQPLAQAHRSALALGDAEYSANSGSVYCVNLLYAGADLTRVENETAAYSDAVGHMNRSTAQKTLKLTHQCILNLMGRAPQPHVLEGEVLNAKVAHEMRQASSDSIFMANLHTHTLMLCYLFHRYREARDNAEQAKGYVANLVGNYVAVVQNVYESLTCLALYGDESALERRRIVRTVWKNQKAMQRWARGAPANFLHKWYLVEAELARVRENDLQAIHSYEKAIELARESHFLQDEALAQELAGQFHLARGRNSLASFYLEGSRNNYSLWGALAKVRDLENRYPWLTERKEFTLSATSTGTRSTAGAGSGTLDWAMALKASQALSEEMLLDKLLRRLMEVALEQAGAQSCMLLLKKDGGWHIEAQQDQRQQPATVLQAMPLDESRPESLPLSLLRYVERSGESVMIHDAASNELTASDPYVRRHGPRSLLMVPLRNQERLIGLLYLENNAATGAFTDARLQVLELLAAQAAISLKNARLYADMERRAAVHVQAPALSLHDS